MTILAAAYLFVGIVGAILGVHSVAESAERAGFWLVFFLGVAIAAVLMPGRSAR